MSSSFATSNSVNPDITIPNPFSSLIVYSLFATLSPNNISRISRSKGIGRNEKKKKKKWNKYQRDHIAIEIVRITFVVQFKERYFQFEVHRCILGFDFFHSVEDLRENIVKMGESRNINISISISISIYLSNYTRQYSLDIVRHIKRVVPCPHCKCLRR